MRILLAQSYTDQSEPLIYPIGLSYLATGLTDYEVMGVDLNLESEPLTALKNALHEFQPDLMGISIRNIKVARPGKHISCFENHQAAIRVMKQEAPHAPLLAGGTAFSLFAPTVMRTIPEIDIGVWGEAEFTVQELLEGDNLSHPERVKSLYYRASETHPPNAENRKPGESEPLGSNLVFTGHAAFPTGQSLTRPRRDIFPLANYTSVPTAIGVQAKRGCPMQCIHCADTFLTGTAMRMRKPKDVADEIESLQNEHAVKHIFFCDQLFNVPPNHAKEIAQEMIDRKLAVKWTAWFNERCTDRELVELCKAAGCYQLSYSPDAVADSMLKTYQKNLKEEDLYNAANVAKQVNIPITFSFMINGPGENWTTLFKMFKFIFLSKLKLGKLFKLHGLFITKIRLYPHTELETRSMDEKLIHDREDLLYPTFYNPASFSWVTDTILWLVGSAWKAKHFAAKVLKPAR